MGGGSWEGHTQSDADEIQRGARRVGGKVRSIDEVYIWRDTTLGKHHAGHEDTLEAAGMPARGLPQVIESIRGAFERGIRQGWTRVECDEFTTNLERHGFHILMRIP